MKPTRVTSHSSFSDSAQMRRAPQLLTSCQTMISRLRRPAALTRLRKAGAGLLFALGAVVVAMPAQAEVGCVGTAPLRGVNLAGAEFASAKLPGTVFRDYTFPSTTDVNNFADMGANMIRLPFLWERMQPVAGGPLDATQIKLVAGVLQTAKARKMCVLLDAHNYGAYRGIKLGQVGASTANFVDFWIKMSVAFPDVEVAALGLMNEPANIDTKQWGDSAKAVVAKLRASKSKHLIVVGGGGFSGAHDWAVVHNGTSSAATFATLKDPLNRMLLEVHQYVDSNYSGTKADCISPAKLTDILTKVQTWAVANQQRMFLGEFGVADTPACTPTLQAALVALRNPAWGGWTYWSAGAWWGKDYIFNVQPAVAPKNTLTLLSQEWKR